MRERPLRIDSIALVSGGLIGLVHCPGRNGRDLAADLAAIEAWHARVVVTLIEAGEFARLGVADLDARMRQRRFIWHHVPIPDMQPPDAAGVAAWSIAEPDLAEALRRGERVLLHCAAGLGRTGMMAARLLVDQIGCTPDAAIATVRAHRPGAIETTEQEAFVTGRRAD